MKDFLKEQLERTNYWLSFSEAKNAALIAFNTAAIAVCVQVSIFPIAIQKVICLLLFVSISISLLSFYSNLGSKISKKQSFNSNASNLLFYKDVAKINDSDLYLKSLEEKYGLSIQEDSKNLCNDYASEIVINSEITVYKYGMFNKAMIVDVFSVLLFLISFIAA